MQENSFFHKYRTIVVFLIIEVLALVAFNFANISEVLFLVSSLLSIAAFVFAFFKNTNRKEFLKLVPIVAGLFIISGIAAFGNFASSTSVLSNIATFFAIPGFFSLGFFARRLGHKKPEQIVLAIGLGFAALTLISTIATWAEYGIFYAQIHKAKPIYFYEGVAYNVTKEMNWLLGFKITEVTLRYGGMFALLCSVFLPALTFLNFKNQKTEFILCAIIGSIGFISIITVPNWRALLFLAIASLFAFVYKYLKEKKLVVNILSLVVVCIIGLGIAFYLVSILNAGIGFKFTGFFDKIFCNNFLMRGPTTVLTGAFGKDTHGSLITLFGYDINSYINVAGEVTSLNSIVQTPSLVFEYEIIKEVGLIGTVLVLSFFATMFFFEVCYIRDSKDSAFLKNVAVMMLVAFMLFATFGFDCKPQSHNTEVYQAFLRSTPFMIILFLCGFTYFAPNEESKPQEKMEDISL